MKSLGKILVKFIVASALVMCVSIAASASQAGYIDNFAVALPAHQGDIELNAIAREHDSSTYKYFTITIRDIQSGNAVRAWTETTWGSNLSKPEKYAYIQTQNMPYDTVPDAGTNVKLNMDNPKDVDVTNSVIGSWTPN